MWLFGRSKEKQDDAVPAVAISSSFTCSTNLLDGCCKGVPFCSSDLNLGQFAELNNGLGKVEDVVTTLEKAVQAHEQRVVLADR